MQYLPCIEVEPRSPANATVIVLHGIGASGRDFEPIVPELQLPDSAAVRFIFPHAPSIPVTINRGYVMPAWYDILAINLERRVDEKQLSASAEAICNLINRETERGVSSERVVVAGFSQGGAVAYQVALTYPKPLAGLIGLSTYLANFHNLSPHASNRELPTLVCHGTQDLIVPESLGRRSFERLQELGLNAAYKTYPLGHSVNRDEIADISSWLKDVLSL